METQSMDLPLDSPFNALLAETQEMNLLMEKGVHFTVPKRSLLRFIGSPERTFEIKQPFLGTLDAMSRVSIDLAISEEAIDANPLQESKRLSSQNARKCARIIAMAILNGYWRIKLFAPFLATYLFWRLTPEKLIQLTLMINRISNLGDFINSIRLMSASRTTAPTRIEQ